MTLSARLVLRPSGRVALLEVAMPVVGLALAAATSGARWPGSALAIDLLTLSAMLVVGALSWRRWTARRVRTVFVSDHHGVAVTGSDAIWRVAEPSLVRPGFMVLALRPDGPAARRGPWILPLFDVELAADDRRALHRFLAWCLRGGAPSGSP